MCLLKTCFPNVLSMTIGVQRSTAQSFFLCPRLASGLGLMPTSRAPRSSSAEPLPPGFQQSVYFTEIRFYASSSPARLQSLARCELPYHPVLPPHLAFSSWCSEVGERTFPLLLGCRRASPDFLFSFIISSLLLTYNLLVFAVCEDEAHGITKTADIFWVLTKRLAAY